jgi:beta-galactosidase
VRDFNVTFDRLTGSLTGLAKHGTDYLTSGPVPCFTRPISGVDATKDWGYANLWQIFAPESTSVSLSSFICRTDAGNSRVTIETEQRLKFAGSPDGGTVRTEFAIDAGGEIQVRTSFQISRSLPNLPRVGVEWIIPTGFEKLAYYGMGPTENYRDRKQAAKMGVFCNDVEQEHFAFNPPSENGGHEETRWLELADAAGHKLLIAAAVPFHFDVHHNSVADYRAARHEHELTRRPESFLHIDAAHGGIGGDMGWSTVLTDSEQVKAGPYLLNYSIRMA